MSVSRRSFLATAAIAPLVSSAASAKPIPIGLELYSVREDLKKDLKATVRAVAKMGYEDVEFYAPYFQWTPEYAKEVRVLLNDLGIRCLSTHNDASYLTGENIARAIDLNQILGSKILIVASAGKVEGLDGWKAVAEQLNQAADKLKQAGLRTGYHNHLAEFQAIEGQRPMEILAANTMKSVVLQLDVGTCVEAGSDPVAWINQNPGRIVSLHLKDWSPENGFQVLFGEGTAPWQKIFQAAEKAGGVEYYLIEQEGSRYPALETAERCLASFKQLHG